MKNELLIKFPLETNQKQINYAKKLLNDKKFVNSKIIDLRIKNRIINMNNSIEGDFYFGISDNKIYISFLTQLKII